jgi:hypothetical protein
LPSAHVNTAWEQVAAAADGSVYTDTALARNWSNAITVDATHNTSLMIWCPQSRKWWAFGRDSGSNAPLIYNSVGGKIWYASVVPASDGFAAMANRYSAATDGLGTIVFGGQPAVASANKIRQTQNAGTTWNARAIGAADTVGVAGVAYISHLSLFVAGLASQANNIYTSPSGATWTQRTTPNTDGRSQFATNGSIILAGNSTAAQSRILSSTDLLTWTERTMPYSAQWNHVVWIPDLSKFLAIAFDGKTAASTDGITWTTAGLNLVPATSTINVAVYGRLVVVLGSDAATHPVLYTSVDGGANWVLQYMFDGTSGGSCIAYGNKQFMCSDAGSPSKHWLGFGGGF